MGIPSEDVVIINQSERQSDPSVITVNCPDKTGLGCDLCRIILFFGLSIVKGDASTDGKWCYVVLWVVGKQSTRWDLLKKRLIAACPSCSGIYYYYNQQLQQQPPNLPCLFLFTFCCLDRKGLLHDVTALLCELELVINKVKLSTTPDGNVVGLFFISDTREMLHTKERQQDTRNHLKAYLGDVMISCEIELVSSEIANSSQGTFFLPPALTDDMFSLELSNEQSSGSNEQSSGSLTANLSVTADNSLSPSHTLVQIICEDHKGILYDIMRTLKDYNIQISYGRFSVKGQRMCEVDLFVMMADGKKIVDPNKQNSLCSRLRMELSRPLRVAMVSRDPDTELLVANPVELSGKGRPLVIYDITLALKKLNTCIFTAEIGRHVIGDREWEVYRIRLDEGDGLSVSWDKIKGEVRKMLMGWE